jgi:hypothetical protein
MITRSHKGFEQNPAYDSTSPWWGLSSVGLAFCLIHLPAARLFEVALVWLSIHALAMGSLSFSNLNKGEVYSKALTDGSHAEQGDEGKHAGHDMNRAPPTCYMVRQWKSCVE